MNRAIGQTSLWALSDTAMTMCTRGESGTIVADAGKHGPVSSCERQSTRDDQSGIGLKSARRASICSTNYPTSASRDGPRQQRRMEPRWRLREGLRDYGPT